MTVRGRLCAAVIASTVALTAGYASPPGQPHGGAASFWTRQRLLDARPFRPAGPSLAPSPWQSASSRHAIFSPRVGAIFSRNGSVTHFCTASVVTSPGKDLLITAAHCINSGSGGGYRQDIVFIPDYRNGRAPSGIWTPERLLVAPQWSKESDPSLDVGFVVLKPRDGHNIQEILGGNRLGIDTGYQQLVRVTGYPASGNAPVTCVNWTARQSASQLRFDCGGYANGTSGSPWVAGFDPQTRTGTIVGVIGGYQEGGTEAVSYSSYLGPEVLRLYREAAAAGAAAPA
jgi:V8-like Glu-specific endopeptidase